MKGVGRTVLLRQLCPWKTMDGPGPSGCSSNMMYIANIQWVHQSLLHHGDREWHLTKDSVFIWGFLMFGCRQPYPDKIFVMWPLLLSVFMRSERLIFVSSFEENLKRRMCREILEILQWTLHAGRTSWSLCVGSVMIKVKTYVRLARFLTIFQNWI